MKILYLANPKDGHDLKWISFFVEGKFVKGFMMPRKADEISTKTEFQNGKFEVVSSITDFSVTRFYQTLLTAFKIKRFIKKNNIQAIHILFAEPNALWCLFRDYFGVPIIVSCRGTDVLKTIPRAFQNKNLINLIVAPAYKRAFRKADFITGTSEQQLKSIFNFSERKENISIVRTGVLIDKILTDTSGFFPLESQAPYILFPRYIKPLYNHEFCLEAISLLPADVKAKYKMVFVGKDCGSTDFTYQKTLLAKMDSLKDVEFIFLPEMSQNAMFELYKRSSLVVMTPHSDGSPVSAMEAIVCNAKVILGPLPYDEEIFKIWTHQLTGWSEKELSALITHCLSIPSKIDVASYAPLVDRNTEMSKIVKIYQGLISSSKALHSINGNEVFQSEMQIQRNYQQCTRCILDTNDDLEIRFDENGVCSHCHSYDIQESKYVMKGEAATAELNKLINQVKEAGQGKPYDCIIGLSGGVDSTYLAYQAKKFGLRPLAVHFDNGWNSELAVKNIENIINRLGFDLFTFVVDWEEFKDIQLSFLKASVVDIELVTDHAILTKLYQLAIKNKIRYILSGTNVVTEGILPSSWIHNKRDHVHIRAIQEQFGAIPIKTFPLFNSTLKWTAIWKRIKSLSLLDLMPYNKKEVKETIAKELGWRDYGGKHYESVFTRFYQGHILPKKFGIDKRKAHLSNLICSNQMTRTEALEEIKKPGYEEATLRSDYEFVLKKLGLTAEEFEAIMKTPVRKHTEFPVEPSIYDRYPVLRMLRPAWLLIKNIRKLT